MQDFTVGIDIGGTKIAVGIFDSHFTLLEKRAFPFDTSAPAEKIFSHLCENIDGTLAKVSAGGKISRVGVGVPGIVDTTGKIVLFTPNAPLLNGFPLWENLHARYRGAEIRLENDANAAALAEHTLGMGRGFSDMLYATISTGIGAGLILNGKLFRGSHRSAGEIGHVILVPGGQPCSCGNSGCAEAYAGGANFPHQIQARIDAGEHSLMRELSVRHGRIDGEVLFQAYTAGDALAIEFFGRITQILGILFYNIYKILDIPCFVLGGGLTNMGEALLTPIRNNMRDLCHDIDQERTFYVNRAHFSSDEIGIYGAAMVFEENMGTKEQEGIFQNGNI